MKCDRATALWKWTPPCLMLTSILLLLVPGAWIHLLRSGVLTVVSPLDNLVAGSLETLARAPAVLLNVEESPSEVKQLRSQLTAVKSERDSALAKVAELERTLKALTATREIVGDDAPLIPTPVDILEKPARVLAAHQGVRGTLLIAAGRISGIMEGDAVVYAKYVVGRVISTGLDTSQVQLVTDPGFRAAAVTYPACVEGIVQGESGAHCIMKHVRRTDPVAVDDLVLTSGFAGVFPRGFVVGRVSKVSSTYDARFQRVEIDPAVMPDQLETVVVLIKKSQDGP